jgi:hypothetical protein
MTDLNRHIPALVRYPLYELNRLFFKTAYQGAQVCCPSYSTHKLTSLNRRRYIARWPQRFRNKVENISAIVPWSNLNLEHVTTKMREDCGRSARNWSSRAYNYLYIYFTNKKWRKRHPEISRIKQKIGGSFIYSQNFSRQHNFYPFYLSCYHSWM